MDKSMEISSRRVRELLEAHAGRAAGGASETVDGVVTVKVDARLQLTAVHIHDKAIDAKCRAALEKAIVEAVNGARLKALKSASESLSKLRDSAEWKSAMDGVFGPQSRSS